MPAGLQKLQRFKVKLSIFRYMFIDTQKVSSNWVKESPAITTREELKKDAAREEWTKKSPWAANP